MATFYTVDQDFSDSLSIVGEPYFDEACLAGRGILAVGHGDGAVDRIAGTRYLTRPIAHCREPDGTLTILGARGEPVASYDDWSWIDVTTRTLREA